MGGGTRACLCHKLNRDLGQDRGFMYLQSLPVQWTGREPSRHADLIGVTDCGTYVLISLCSGLTGVIGQVGVFVGT